MMIRNAQLAIKLMTRDIAVIIYNSIYNPGDDAGDREIMPHFDLAEREEIGGYVLAMKAAVEIQRQILERECLQPLALNQVRISHNLGEE